MKLYYPITVDLYKPYPLPLVEAQQNNIGRGVLVTLTAQGAVITPTGESIQLYAKKPDGTISYLPCTISGSQIQCDFTNQMLALPGIVQVELQMIGGTSGNETEITTPIFCVKVNPSNVDDSAVESQDEFPALVTALAEVAELKANGLKGDPGEAATIQVGTVTASDPGSNPQVTNTGTEQNAILNFVLPRGQQGPQGIPGEGVTFGAYSSFPNPGQTNVLYVDTATTDALSIWRWNGTEYVTVDTSDIAVIADPYNPDNTYAARAYCTNEGGFYKSKQAIDVAEAWTPSHWTKTTVAAELSALNSRTFPDPASGTAIGEVDSYTAPSDGWLSLRLSGYNTNAQGIIECVDDNRIVGQSVYGPTGEWGVLTAMLPVKKGKTYHYVITSGTFQGFYFFGNHEPAI